MFRDNRHSGSYSRGRVGGGNEFTHIRILSPGVGVRFPNPNAPFGIGFDFDSGHPEEGPERPTPQQISVDTYLRRASHEERKALVENIVAELDSSRRKEASLRIQLDEVEDESERLRARLKISTEEMIRLKGDNIDVTNRYKALFSENTRLKEGNTHDRREIEKLREEERTLRSLFNDGGEASGADVTQSMTDLRTNVNNFLASLSEWWERPKGQAMPHEQVQPKFDKANRELDPVLGRPLSRLVTRCGSKGEDKDTTIMVYAMQACMMQHLSDALGKFCLGLTDEQNSILATIDNQVHKNESQALSFRWRTLTHTYARSSVQDYDNVVRNQIISSLVDLMCSVYYLSGGEEDIEADSKREFEGEIADIADATVQLMAVIKERATTALYTVYAPSPGEQFDAEKMQSEIGSESKDDSVLCTLDIGLREHIRKGNTLQDTVRVLQKAKVILSDAYRKDSEKSHT